MQTVLHWLALGFYFPPPVRSERGMVVGGEGGRQRLNVSAKRKRFVRLAPCE